MKTHQPVQDRAKDAVAQCLINQLHVPTVYFDAPWPSGRNHTDLLIIDRAGTGDVHVVEITKDLDAALKYIPRILKIPAQFRWIAYVDEPVARKSLHRIDRNQRRACNAPLYPPKGMGRVGVIAVGSGGESAADDVEKVEDSFDAEVVVSAERFPGSYYDEADEFIKAHRPDIMFR